MGPHELLVAHLNAALLVGVFAGLIVRRRYRLCWSFLVYSMVTLVGNRLVSTWPNVFFTSWFWSLKETIYGLLTICIAAEIGILTCARFPRARRLMLLSIGAIAAATMVGLLLPRGPLTGYMALLAIGAPRGQAGLLWLLAVVVILAAYYRLPVHPFHRGLLLGFGLYLGGFTAAMTFVRAWGVAGYPYYAALDPAAYAASVGVWVWASWRSAPALSPELRRLQPWAEPAP